MAFQLAPMFPKTSYTFIKRLKNLFQKKILVILFIVLLFKIPDGYSEGTRQLMPASTDFGYIQIFDLNTTSRPFASFNCPEPNRLNIHVCNAGEIIYMGFRQTNNDVYFRLKDPTGTTVTIPGLVPVAPNTYLLPTAGMGRINNYTEAYNGPSAIAGAVGYNAITYTSTMAGDYYIEFNPVSPTVITPVKRIFTYFDITVASAANVPINGRIWSRTWDFTTNGGNNQFRALMHVYSDDGIVTALNFNGMQPFGFTMSCNATGCTDTGNPSSDRVSRFGNTTYPQYKIFLNDPDPACFPTGTFGNLLNTPTITGCGSNRCINIEVDRAGYIGVLLDLNGVPGYQPGTSDRQLFANAVPGANCIPWDGLNGLGNPVASGTNIDLQLDYYNGITHLPLYDVEHNRNGYIVTLVRPAGPAPRLFWEDTPITTGTALDGLVNLTGCNLATGCHRWQNRGNNSGPETINTWWYANIITSSAQYTNFNITTDADTRNPGTGAANDTLVCGDLTPKQLSGGISGATGGDWTTTGNGTFSPAISALNATYLPTATDVAGGFVYLKLTSTGNGPCPAVADSIRMTFQPVPTANAGSDIPVCANNPTVILNGSVSNATGGTWSGGSGNFVANNNTLNASYTPNATEINNGSVTLTLTTTGNGVCSGSSDQMNITIQPAPEVNAGPDNTVCANNPAAVIAATVTNATSQIWSGGAGTFSPNNTSLNITYTPTAAEIAAGTVTLTLTASRAGCTNVSDQVIITIEPSPIVSAGNDQSVCHNNSTVTLAGTVTNSVTYSWTGGTGTFSPDVNSLTASYTPTLAERNSGSVMLTLTATRAGCNPVSDAMNITITPSPTIDAGGNQTVCANNPNVTLSGSTSTGSGVWSNGCGIFVPGPSTLNAQYTPCATEISLGTAALILTSSNNGNCSAVTDTVLLIITPAPTANAGPDQTVCSNNAVTTLSGSTTNASSRSWSGGSGIFSPSAFVVNPQYTPTATEISNGSVTLTLTASRATCNNVTDQITIFFSPAPTVNAGADQTVCHNNPNVTLNGSVTVATGGAWSGGAGTFSPDANTLSAVYTPTLAERDNGSVTLTLTTTGNGNCTPVQDQMTITISPAPTVNAGTDASICENNASVTLNGTVTIASGATWTGGGTFNPNPSDLNAVYIPSAGEISAGTATLTLTSTGNGNCNAVSDQVIITITNAPVVDAGPNQTVCADNPSVNLSGNVSIASGGIWSGGAGIFSSGNTDLNSAYTPTVGEINSGSVTLTLTSTGNGNCNAVSDQMTITINPAPTINAGADQVLCGNTGSVPLSGVVTVAAGGTWSSSGSGSFSPSATSLSASYIPSPSDITAGAVTLTLTTTGNGLCNALTDQLTVTFTEVPGINAGPDQIVCTNDFPVQLIASGSPATWSGGNGTFSDINALNATYTPSGGEVSGGSVTLTITTIPSGACPTVSDQITITLPPAPIADAGADQTMCGNLSSLNLNGTITNATGGFWSTSGTGGFTPNPGALNATYLPSAQDQSDGTITLTLTTVGNGACSAHSDQMILTIQPAVTVDAGPDQTVCADLAQINLNGSITNGIGGSWSITSGSGNFSPDNTTLNGIYNRSSADSTAGTVTLTLTSNAVGSCPSMSDEVIYTITPVPTINAGPDQLVCTDTSSITLNGSVSVATGGNWTTNGTGVFSPDASTLNTTYFLSASDKTSASLTFTLTSTGNGTCNSVSDQMTLAINPAPTINAGTDQTICADAGTINLNGSITVAGGGTWVTSGSGIFNNPNLLNAIYTPSASDITDGTVTLTLTSTGNGLCQAVTDQMILTITPAPTVSAGFDQNICANSSANLSGTITVATGATWTSTGTGTFLPSPTSLVATYQPSDADTISGTVTLTLTTTGNGNCNAYTDQVVVTIQPVPIVNAGPDQTICADSFHVALNGSVTNAGGGIWSSSGTGNFFPDVITLNGNFVPSTDDRNTGSIILTLTSTTNGPCAAVSDDLNLIITPAPEVNVGSDQTICADSAFVNLSGNFTVSSGIIWTTSGNGVFADNTSINTTYTPSAADRLAGSVTLTAASTGNGSCRPVSDNLVLTITPAPTINAGADQTICASSTTINLNGSVTIATGGSWTTTGTGLFNPDNLSPVTGYTISSADTSAGFVTFTLISSGNGTCKPVSDQVTVFFESIPVVNAGTDQTVCANNLNVALSGMILNAIGGTWTSSGAGSFAPNANSLSASYVSAPADTTAGSVTLILTSTGNGTCTPVSDQMVITFNPVPVVNAGPDQTVCADQEGIQLGGSVLHATGGSWSTNGTGNFTPTISNLNAIYYQSDADTLTGSVVVTLISSAGICGSVSDNMTINFTPAPTVDAGGDISICMGAPSINLQGSVTVATGGFWSSNGTGSFSDDENLTTTYFPSPADQTAGSVIITLITTGNGNCGFYTDAITLSFDPVPFITAGNDTTVCSNGFPVQLKGSGTSGRWSGGLGSFAPNDSTLKARYTPHPSEIGTTVTLTLTAIVDPACLASSDQVAITIQPGPIANANTDQIICTNTSTINLNGSVSIATGGTWTSTGSGTFANSNSGITTYTPSVTDKTTGSITFTLTTTGNGICNASNDKMVVSIIPGPTINAGLDQTICANASVNLHASVTNATGVQWSGGVGGYNTSDTDPDAVYTPTTGESAGSNLTLTVTATGTGICPPVSDDIIISFSPAPTANAGPDDTACATTASVNLNGSVTIASGGFWTTSGSGTFSPSPSALNATYSPSAADTVAEDVVLTLTTKGNGTCNSVADQKELHLAPVPIVNAGINDTICSSEIGSLLNGTVFNASGGIWTSFGSGTFNPDATTLNTSYEHSSQDIINGAVNLMLTSSGNSHCVPVSDFVTITISPAPIASVNAGFDQSLCLDAVEASLSGFVIVASGGMWSSTGSGSFVPNNSDLNAHYIFSAGDKAGPVTLTLTSTGNGVCTPVSDDMTINFTPVPTVDAGPSHSVCADTTGIHLDGSVTIASGGMWTSSGTGFFTPDAATLDAVYIPSAFDKTNGSVGFTLTTTGNGTCNLVTDNVVVTITKAPTINAGLDRTVCANSTSINLTGTVTGAAGGTWTSSGNGGFSNPNVLNTFYIPVPSDTVTKVINMTLTSTGNGNCNAVSDQVKITFQPIPIINAGPDQTICTDYVSLNLNGTVGNATSGTWSTSGGGIFSPINALSTSYAPSQSDKNAGTVTLTLISSGNGACSPVSDQAIITIDPQPLVNAGGAIICDISNGVALNGSVLNAGGGIWSSSGSGVFAPDATTLSTFYYPSSSDVTTGSITLTLTSTANGTCSPASHSTILLIEPLPVANAGQDQYICRGSSTILTAQLSPDVNYTWSTISGGAIMTDPTVTISASTDTSFVLSVTDSKGCTSRDTINVGVYDLPNFNLDPHHCLSNSLIIDSDPQSLPFVPGIFQWYKDGVILTGQNKSIISPMETGNYTITYSYGNCAVSAPTSVTKPPVLTHKNNIGCEAGTVQITISSDVSGVTYIWASGPSGMDLNTISANVLPDTTFYVATVTDIQNCSSTDSVRVIGIPTPQLVLSDTSGCEGVELILNGRPVNLNNVDDYSAVYAWFKDNTLLASTNDSLWVTASGQYVVSLNIDQCGVRDTSDIIINPTPVSSLVDETRFCKQKDNFIILDAGAASGNTYLWTASPGVILDSNNTPTVSAQFEGTYTVVITNIFDCSVSDSVFVNEVCPPLIDGPTAFLPGTPGPDGTFRIFGNYFTNFKLEIFNRWGEVIFTSTDKNEGWDGTYKGEMMPVGVYPWVVTYEGEDPKHRGPHRKEGMVTLIR